jgi:hypothetical protein
MKTMLLILVVGILAVGSATIVDADKTETPIPAWYYNSPCQQPEGVNLHEWLAKLQHRYELEPDGWDCSQTAVYIEWLCENCDYDTVIKCNTVHCWVVVGGDSYETTSLHWKVAEQHRALVQFQDINEAWNSWTKLEPVEEWGWWVTYPELRTAP